jgi:hypothetical protein
MTDLDTTETCRIPNVPMREMVFGRRAPRRFRFPSRLIFVAALAVASIGCASGRQAPPEVESVGTLAASYHSIAVQAVHADTDLSGGFQAVEGDDDAGEVATTVSRVNAPESPDGSELPAVAPKDDGIKMGGAR